MKGRIVPTIAILAVVLLVSSMLAFQPVAANGASISRPAAAGGPTVPVERINGHLAGTCDEESPGIFTCHGSFNGTINGLPTERDFHLCITPTSSPGPLPGTLEVDVDFSINNGSPPIDFPDLPGVLRRLEHAGIIRLDPESDLRIFASIFLEDNRLEGTVMYGE